MLMLNRDSDLRIGFDAPSILFPYIAGNKSRGILVSPGMIGTKLVTFLLERRDEVSPLYPKTKLFAFEDGQGLVKMGKVARAGTIRTIDENLAKHRFNRAVMQMCSDVVAATAPELSEFFGFGVAHGDAESYLSQWSVRLNTTGECEAAFCSSDSDAGRIGKRSIVLPRNGSVAQVYGVIDHEKAMAALNKWWTDTKGCTTEFTKEVLISGDCLGGGDYKPSVNLPGGQAFLGLNAHKLNAGSAARPVLDLETSLLVIQSWRRRWRRLGGPRCGGDGSSRAGRTRSRQVALRSDWRQLPRSKR
jgi:hypothetical protein